MSPEEFLPGTEPVPRRDEAMVEQRLQASEVSLGKRVVKPVEDRGVKVMARCCTD